MNNMNFIINFNIFIFTLENILYVIIVHTIKLIGIKIRGVILRILIVKLQLKLLLKSIQYQLGKLISLLR